ncbi:hypothetical protein D3C72_1831510 [compost metagenome]
MGQAGAIVVAVGGDEDLRLVFQPAKSGRMHDTVAVTLKVGSRRACRLRVEPAARRPGIRREWRMFAVTEAERFFVERHFTPAWSSH